MKKVGEEIKRRRVAREVHQAHLAYALGRSQGWVSLVERGAIVPHKEFVEKIFTAIDKVAALQCGGTDTVTNISGVAEQFSGVRLPSRLEMANRPTARSKQA